MVENTNGGDALNNELDRLMDKAVTYSIPGLLTAVREITRRHGAIINCFEEYNGVVTLRVSAAGKFDTTYDRKQPLQILAVVAAA